MNKKIYLQLLYGFAGRYMCSLNLCNCNFRRLTGICSSVDMQIKDAYTLKFFEDDPSRLPEWCNKDDDVKLPFCQIKGRYRMELPEYNTMLPYPNMNERCPSLPPNYIRTANCWSYFQVFTGISRAFVSMFPVSTHYSSVGLFGAKAKIVQ